MGSHGLRNPLPGPVAGTSGRASHQHGGRWGCNGLHRSRTISGPDGGYEYDKRLWTLVERARSRPLGAPPSKSLLPTPAVALQCDDGSACRRRGGMACSALPGLRMNTHGTNASCDIDVWTHASHRAGGRGVRLARLRAWVQVGAESSVVRSRPAGRTIAARSASRREDPARPYRCAQHQGVGRPANDGDRTHQLPVHRRRVALLRLRGDFRSRIALTPSLPHQVCGPETGQRMQRLSQQPNLVCARCAYPRVGVPPRTPCRECGGNEWREPPVVPHRTLRLAARLFFDRLGSTRR